MHIQQSRVLDVCIAMISHCQKLRSRMELFMSEECQAAETHGSSSVLAEATCSLQPWGSQTELLEEREQVKNLTSPPSSAFLMPETEARSTPSS